MSQSEVRDIASSILGKRLRPFGFQSATVEEEEDFDGYRVWRVVAHVKDTVPARELIDTTNEIRTVLLNGGEERLVYLSARSQSAEPENDEGEEAV